jgi:hypothetical protein
MAINGPFDNTKKIGRDESYTEINPGPYVAIVKDNVDPTKMGRLKVVIPTLSASRYPYASELISVQYLPPFYGAKSPEAVNKTDVTNYETTQHSYGMWMVPPDIDTQVLVIFAEGRITQGYWIGCIQSPFMNNMVPGIASSPDTSSPNTGGDFGLDKKALYGTDTVPSGEINRGLLDSVLITGIDKTKKPIHPFAKTLRDQGLIQDNIRGNTTSSARRETPSNVFGISTPGPIDQRSSKTDKLGPKDERENFKTTRKAGHTFVMDDGDAQGENQLIRLRTSSGHQLLMHDTAGVMYLANADGTVWMEFSNSGMVDVYAQTGYNLRSGADINFHAEGNINMYANKNIKIKANESTGGVSLDGANLYHYATENVRVEGNYISNKAKTIVADASDRNIQQGMTRVDLIGGQVHFNSFPVIQDMVTPLQRTNYTQPYGTGTALTTYPDVSLQPLGTVLKVDRALPGLSGMRVPTHEPFWGHQDIVPSFGSVGGTDKTIGSVGYIEDANRNSDLMSIRWAQYKADITNELIKNPTKSLDSVTSLFNAGYSKLYGTATNFLNDKLTGYIQLGDGAFETYNQITSGINKLNSSSVTNVLVNEAGILYTKGVNQVMKTTGLDKVTGKLGQANSVITSISSLLSTKTTEGGISVPGVGDIEGIIPGVGKVNSVYNNISKITETYKNVVGGKITSVTEVSSAISTFGKDVATKVATVATSIGKYFGFGK